MLRPLYRLQTRRTRWVGYVEYTRKG